MESTIVESDFEVQTRIAGKNTLFERGLEALLNCGPVFLWNVTTDNGRLELETFTRLKRSKSVVDFSELTGTTRLFLVGVAIGNLLGDSLTVSNLWSAYIHLNFMSPLQDIDFNIEVKLTHSFKNGLTGIKIGFNTERGVFLNHLTQSITKLLGIRLINRRDGERDHGIREHHWFESGRLILGAKSVTGLDVLKSDQGDNVTRLGAIEFGPIVSVHLNDAANTLGFPSKGI